MSLKITLFSDFICPFCYIGFATIQKLKAEFDLDIEWRGFQIHAEWPATGIPAEKVYGVGDSQTRKAAWERISTMAHEAGIAMRPPTVLTNSRRALAVCEYAIETGRGEAFEERVYRAYFYDGANIGEIETLQKLGADAGLDPEQVAAAIDEPKYEMKLKNNSLIAHSHGVSGVPTFFIGNYPMVGAQPEDTMRKILTRATAMIGAAK